MQIDGERIHHHHFAGACANQARTEFAELLVEINPRAAREHVPLNGKSRPVIQFLLHHHARGARHETQGIATQVSEWPTVFTEWMFKFRTHGAQRVRRVELACVFGRCINWCGVSGHSHDRAFT